jgi:hypothetical protein
MQMDEEIIASIENSQEYTNEEKAKIYKELTDTGISKELAAEMAGYSSEIVQRLAQDQGTRRMIPTALEPNGNTPDRQPTI